MSVTSEPTSATRPENSLPSTWGKRIVTPGGVQPVRMAASVGCTPALITWTTTSSDLGTGRCRRWTWSSSGGPKLSIAAARMCVLNRPMMLAASVEPVLSITSSCVI